MPALYGKKYWNEVALYMEPVLGLWRPKPPIINIHGIHALQLASAVEKARTITYWITIIVLINSGLFLLTAVLELDVFSWLLLVFAIIYVAIYFFVNLQVLLKLEYVLQYEELSNNGQLEYNLARNLDQMASRQPSGEDILLSQDGTTTSIGRNRAKKSVHKRLTAQSRIRASLKSQIEKNRASITPEERMEKMRENLSMMVGAPPKRRVTAESVAREDSPEVHQPRKSVRDRHLQEHDLNERPKRHSNITSTIADKRDSLVGDDIRNSGGIFGDKKIAINDGLGTKYFLGKLNKDKEAVVNKDRSKSVDNQIFGDDVEAQTSHERKKSKQKRRETIKSLGNVSVTSRSSKRKGGSIHCPKDLALLMSFGGN